MRDGKGIDYLWWGWCLQGRGSLLPITLSCYCKGPSCLFCSFFMEPWTKNATFGWLCCLEVLELLEVWVALPGCVQVPKIDVCPLHAPFCSPASHNLSHRPCPSSTAPQNLFHGPCPPKLLPSSLPCFKRAQAPKTSPWSLPCFVRAI